MAKTEIPGWAYILTGVVVAGFSLIIGLETMLLFFIVGIIFLVVGAIKLLKKPKKETHHKTTHHKSPQHHNQHRSHHAPVPHCKSCGAKLHISFKYCPGCGTPR